MNINNFDVESFLLSRSNLRVFSDKDLFTIDRLCKKVDVVKNFINSIQVILQ